MTYKLTRSLTIFLFDDDDDDNSMWKLNTEIICFVMRGSLFTFHSCVEYSVMRCHHFCIDLSIHMFVVMLRDWELASYAISCAKCTMRILNRKHHESVLLQHKLQFTNVENRPFLEIFEWISGIYWRIPLKTKTELYKYDI